MSNDIDLLKSIIPLPKGNASSSTSANGHSYHRTISSPISHSHNFHRRYNKSAVYINIVFILMAFFILIQIFDPAIQNPVPEHDVLHQHILNTHHQHQHQHPMNDSSSHNQNSKTSLSSSNRNQQNDRIMSLLKDAGIANELSDEQGKHLPRWEQVIDLFGDDVVIVGKEDCERYRNRVPLQHRRLGVAGMFNTGTNLLETQLRKNIQLPKESLWQVPWGKHRMADVKYNHTAADMEQYDKDKVLPVVMIRDPFAWLQSMCASPYAAHWRHDTHHCPNMIPNEMDHEKFKNLHDVIEVTITFDGQSKRHFQSLVHLWSEWYAQYLHVDYPILMIRYEDLVFQPAIVLNEIAHCVEGTVQQPIQYQLKSSKAHGSGTDYIKALGKTADASLRSNNMTIQDLEYAAQHLDQRLMKTFHYHIPKS